MAGFDNDVIFGTNIDLSGALPVGQAANIFQTNGQLLIGTTALNAGGTHINMGNIVSPNGSIVVGYVSPNITIQTVGGTGASEFFVDANTAPGTNPVLPNAAGQIQILGAQAPAGSTLSGIFTNSTAPNEFLIEIQRSSAQAATTIGANGISHFNSAQFTVDASGFVSIVGGAFNWLDVSGAFNALAETGYFITNTATGTLPVAPIQGTTIRFSVDTAAILTIQASAGQFIRIGTTISAAAGTAVSTLRGDSIELVYRLADLTWIGQGGVGVFNVV